MRSFSICVTAGAVLWLACAVHDARASGPAAGAPVPDAAAVPQEPTAAPVTGIGMPLTSDSLQSMRGGDSTTTNNVDIRGGVDGNSATNTVSGTNVIQDGSFANASGISTVIQNSGSNVLIQNGTVVNVQFVDPGL